MRVFISAGEASGDAYGAALVRAIRAMEPAAAFEAMGARELREAGVRMVADASRISAIGVLRSLLVVPRASAAAYAVKRALAQGDPGLFIPIDFGFVNIRLAKHAKKRGWKVLYFIPPGSWKRDRQGADLAQLCDAIVTPFPWSADLLSKAGARVSWFGHPIKSLLSEPAKTREGLAILPGSRVQEIDHNLPAIAEALRGLPPAEFAVAPTFSTGELQERWRRLAPERLEDRFTAGDVAGVLGRARAAIVCSGTATLQAALMNCPMVVIYRFSKLMAMEAKLLRLDRKIRFISLPNIFLERAAVPELIGDAASPAAIRAQLEALKDDGPARQAQLEAFRQLNQLLGPSDCIPKTAELAVAMAQRVLRP